MSYIKTEFGKMYFDAAGSESSGGAIVMIHDNGHSSKFFDSELKFYSSYFKVITIDLLNHGKSDPYKGNNFWADNASGITAVCEKLKIKKTSLLGVGCGSYVALNSMLKNPALIHKAIIDSFPGEGPYAEYIGNLKQQRENIKNTPQKHHYAAMNGSKWEKILEWNTEMQSSFVERGLPVLAGNIDDIKTSVLMTASVKDEIISNSETRLKEFSTKLKKSYFHIFNNGGHPAFINKSDEFRSLSLRFLLA